MQKEKINKIFCIGLNKTGSTSLDAAFKILGFKNVHYSIWYPGGGKEILSDIIRDNSEHNRMLFSGIEGYDAYSDFFQRGETQRPFKILDEQYPNSKFILNTRDLRSWLRSRERHVLKKPNLIKLQKENPSNAWFNIDQAAWRKDFIEYHENVLFYFRNRPADFLVINVPAGEGWGKLCPFLGVPIPNKNFPYKHKTSLTRVFPQIIKRALFR